MASTRKRARQRTARQAAPGAWTHEELVKALHSGTLEDNIAILKRIGFLTKSGKYSRRYLSWSKKIGRTEVPLEDARPSKA